MLLVEGGELGSSLICESTKSKAKKLREQGLGGGGGRAREEQAVCTPQSHSVWVRQLPENPQHGSNDFNGREKTKDQVREQHWLDSFRNSAHEEHMLGDTRLKCSCKKRILKNCRGV